MILFLDTTALVKLYIAEPGSDRLLDRHLVEAAAAEGLVTFDPVSEDPVLEGQE